MDTELSRKVTITMIVTASRHAVCVGPKPEMTPRAPVFSLFASV